MKARMVSPHILDSIAQAHQIVPVVRSDQEGRSVTTAKGKGKRTGTHVRKLEKVVLSDEQLRRDLAHAIVRCTTFYTLEQPQDLVDESAAFLEALMRLWGKRGIEAADVWREIDHRLQLGNLLTQINRDIPLSPQTTRKFWRPSSTKLP
ncbi:hypothetical protein [Asaia prunellae]|uniref:hypothetical protein n=1 Tax=Asaia prunellae TaxID=610245 RepID=UPI000A7BA596|nr:hypothetical protein [Asaia prunellae]